MKLRLTVRHIIYFIKSENAWFPQVSYAVLPHSYHFIYARDYGENSGMIDMIGTKNPTKVYTINQKQLFERCDAIFTYVIYSN